MELFFCYWVQADTGYMNSGWQILHINTHKWLFEEMSKEGRKACEGTYNEVLSYVQSRLSETNRYK